MARKILNRRDLREESDAAERLAEVEGRGDQDADRLPKKAVKRKARAKVGKEAAKKAYWAVFSQSLTQVAQFEYSERDEAEKRAKELTESKKTPHFVQLVKKPIEE